MSAANEKRTSRALWSRPVLLAVGCVPLVAVAAALALSHYRGVVERQDRAALVLSELRGDAYRQSALEWQAIAEGESEQSVDKARADGRRRTALLDDLARLGYPREAAALTAIFERYRAAVEEEFALLAAGRREAAEAVDRARVDPTFAQLNERILDAGRRARGAARQATREARLGTWGITGAAIVLIVLLLAAAHRARQRSALTAVLQRGLRDRLAEREHDAHHDPLTGLANRRRFSESLQRAIDARAGSDRRVGVLMIDLDRFKEINDALGHHAGDALLVEIGRRLTDLLRDDDIVARLGGDEFAILLARVRDATAAEEIAGRVREVIERSFAHDGLVLHVSTSVGIALSPDHGDTTAVLLQRADVAMYQAKTARLGSALYAPGDDDRSRDRLALVAELRQALRDDEVVVFYQPKADLRTGHVGGVEALVRWQHPRRGLLAPDQFLPAAERSGLIRDLTLRVLDLALAQVAEWEADGLSLSVAVNLAVANLIDLQLPHDVARLLARWDVAPERLQLEITENLLLADPGRTERVLGHLRELGVTMSLDDFGTGYSSLAHLRRLAVNEIKIDRSFVHEMTQHPDDAAIVESTVRLAHSLDLRVVAEGVETEEHWQRLNALGCDQAQGFLLSRPVPADELTRWLRENRLHPRTAVGGRPPAR